MKSNTKEFILFYILVFLPITNFTPAKEFIVYITFSLAFIIFSLKGMKYSTPFNRVFILFTIILVIQTLLFQKAALISIIGLYTLIFYPYYIIRIFNNRYLELFIKTTKIITVVSLIFYLPSLLFSEVHSIISSIPIILKSDVYLPNQNFLIYTIEPLGDRVLRNSGNFTEPGYFGSILILALSLNIVLKKKLFIKENLWLMAGIISTFSTSSYVALLFILTGYFLIVEKRKIKYLVIPLTIIFSYYIYFELDFMKEKIESHYTTQSEMTYTAGRFGALFADINDIKNYPITGRGIISTTRFDAVESWKGDNAPWQTLNSVSNLMVRLGLIGFVFYLFWLVKSVDSLIREYPSSKYFTFIIIGAVFLVLSAQNLIMTTVFWILIYFEELKYEYKK